MLELTLRLVFSLAVVLGLLALLAKLGARRFRGGQDAMVQVLHRQHLSRGAAVSVVSVGSRILVLGTTEQQVRVLAELDPEDIADGLAPGEVLTLVPGETDATFALPATEVRPAGAHRAAAKGGRRAARPAATTASLSGSVLSTDTWRQAFAAASRKAS